jgi:hypothetical protein
MVAASAGPQLGPTRDARTLFIAFQARVPEMTTTPHPTANFRAASTNCPLRNPWTQISPASIASEAQRAHMNHGQSEPTNNPVPIMTSRTPMQRSTPRHRGSP